MASDCGLTSQGVNQRTTLSFGRKYDRLVVIVSRAANPIARVKKCDKQHKSNQNRREGGLHNLQKLCADGTSPDHFNDRQGDVAAIEHWQRQKIEQREIHVQYHAEPKHAPPAVLTVEEVRVQA